MRVAEAPFALLPPRDKRSFPDKSKEQTRGATVHEKPKLTQTLGMDKNPNHWHGAVYAYSYRGNTLAFGGVRACGCSTFCLPAPPRDKRSFPNKSKEQRAVPLFMAEKPKLTLTLGMDKMPSHKHHQPPSKIVFNRPHVTNT